MNRLQKKFCWLVLALLGLSATVGGLVTWANGFTVATTYATNNNGTWPHEREARLYGHLVYKQTNPSRGRLGPDDWWFLTGYLVGGILSLGYASGLVWFASRLWRPARDDREHDGPHDG